MFVLGQLFASLALLFGMLFKMIYFLLVIRILLSWFRVDPYNEMAQVLNRATEPLLAPFRRLPLALGPIDLSPMLAFITLYFLESFVVGILSQAAYRFR